MAIPTEISFETAEELLNFVSPLNPIWNAGQHIFRGQPDAAFKLTPSIFRRGEGSFGHGSPRKAFADTVSRQIHYELEVISRFLDGCDRSGLLVPGYTKEIKRLLAHERGSFLSAHRLWPQPEMYEIMAVAQHYDVPTRLLDWTERSFVACYFAASSANFELDSNNIPRIAIWALDTTHSNTWETISIIRTPGGTSRNQAAQSGLFTTHNVREPSFSDYYQPEALEDVQEIYGISNTASSLLKITLPLFEAPTLLMLCSKLGVDGSTLFPGYHGVAKSVRDWANIEAGVRMSRSAIDQANADSYDSDPDFH
ncbi:FRG domain-containing protein [Pseudomonas pharyngis]|uniref:FRG domain-containing protein n=1 Tax=Pseudomonas pharyngis TaxID=2892333 RepID=UPI001F3F08C5|nr:FRG domain-containing protein [Pseudomonas pharyngis]